MDGIIVGGGFHLVMSMQGRCASVYRHLDIVVDAGTRKVENLIALFKFLGIKFYLEAVYFFAVSISHHDVEHHLGAVVPHGILLLAIVPLHTYGEGTLILPLSRVVGDMHQVYVVNHTLGRGRTAVLPPAPVLRHHTANAVSQAVERTVALELPLADGTYLGAVHLVEMEIVAIKHKRH